MPTAVSTVDSAAGVRALAQALPRAFLSTKRSYLNLGFHPLQLRRIVLIQSSPTRKSLIIRAARTESQGVSLGFKASRFETSGCQNPRLGKFGSRKILKPILLYWLCLFAIVAYYCMEKGLAAAAISSYSEATHPQVLVISEFEIRAELKLLYDFYKMKMFFTR
ncbi:uncharacterized protein LOC123202780 [Mangifera indica]|uniref:uncharacterized protein LOC123202780 n=1 Tax=Mangifera indica TaxID=29780 RepID=UPI001CFB4BFC|nr:uncharacterized protein LOC123202780 [Mangifera indica]XP_044474836.1 uncharacterized protein LOC123202780 [Mangifera indica]XP_044474837.1 uncharacterized protein LOC123202780 [Mangifera indica]XP_044474838.1 uncharacterized protein LOC123202780 [Mangifera indica]